MQRQPQQVWLPALGVWAALKQQDAERPAEGRSRDHSGGAAPSRRSPRPECAHDSEQQQQRRAAGQGATQGYTGFRLQEAGLSSGDEAEDLTVEEEYEPPPHCPICRFPRSARGCSIGVGAAGQGAAGSAEACCRPTGRPGLLQWAPRATAHSCRAPAPSAAPPPPGSQAFWTWCTWKRRRCCSRACMVRRGQMGRRGRQQERQLRSCCAPPALCLQALEADAEH